VLHNRDFLPRGSGIVTRRPLVLQLINAKQGSIFVTFCYIFALERIESLSVAFLCDVQYVIFMFKCS